MQKAKPTGSPSRLIIFILAGAVSCAGGYAQASSVRTHNEIECGDVGFMLGEPPPSCNYVVKGIVEPQDPSVPAGQALSALNLAGGSSGDLAVVLNTFNSLSVSALNAQVRLLAPVSNNAPTMTAISATSAGLDAISGHTAALRGDGTNGVSSGETLRPGAAWVKVFGAHDQQDAQQAFSGYAARTGGLALGWDGSLPGGGVLGGALSYANTDIDQRDALQGDNDVIDSYQLTGYGMQTWGPAFAEVLASYTRHDYKSHRNTSLDRVAQGSWNGDELSARLQGGYHLALGRAQLIPLASLEWGQLWQSGYTETGAGALDQSYDRSRFNTFKAGLGARLDADCYMGGTLMTHEVRAMAYHDFGDRGLDTTSSFTGGGASFTTPGLRIARDSYVLGLGLTLQPNRVTKISLEYDFEGRAGYQGQSLQLIARRMF